MSVPEDPCKPISVQLTQRELSRICGSLSESSDYAILYANELKSSAKASYEDLDAAIRMGKYADNLLDLREKLLAITS